MAEEIELRIVSRADSKGFNQAAKDIKALKGETDHLGKSFDVAEGEAFDLDEAIVEVRENVKRLSAEMAKSGDVAMFGDLRKNRSFLAELEKVRKELGNFGDDDFGIGEAIGHALGGGMFRGFGLSLGHMSFRGKAIAALVGLAAAAAPAIGAVLGGAIAGVGFIGAAAGGIFAASKDAGVRQAAQEFSRSISREFFNSGDSFIEPVKKSLGILRDDFDALNLEGLFTKAAPGLEIFAHGVGDFVKNLMPGFNAVMDDSERIAQELADGLGYLGTGFSDMFREIMQSEGTLEGLRTLFFLLGDTARFLGKAMGGLGNAFHEIGVFGAEVSGVLEDIPLLRVSRMWGSMNDQLERIVGTGAETETGFRALNSAAGLLIQGLDPFPAFLALAREEARKLNVELGKLFGAGMSAAAAADDYEAAVDDLTESLKEHGRTIDKGTEKGRANRAAFRDAISSAQEMRDANVLNGMSVTEANRRYMDQVAAIEKIGIKAGVTKKELEGMAGDYAISVLASYSYKGSMGPAGSLGRSIKFQQFAAGGDTPANEPFWAGEGGVPELVFPTGRPQYVMNGADSARYPSAKTSSPGAGGGGTFKVVSGAGSVMERAVVEILTRYIRAHDGDGRAIGIRR